jgi:hypothetical protein
VGFPYADLQGRTDLLFANLGEGEIGAAERDWPGLWEAALASKGFHRWLIGGRLMTAQAQIALRAGRPEAAAAAATEAIVTATRNGRLKYEVASRLVRGCALAEMGMAEEGLAELRTALSGADRLGHPPARWQTAFALARILMTIGDDRGAEAAASTAVGTIRAFADTLADEHRAGFLSTPSVTEVLAIAS